MAHGRTDEQRSEYNTAISSLMYSWTTYLKQYFVRYIEERIRTQQTQGSKYAPAYIEPHFDDQKSG